MNNKRNILAIGIALSISSMTLQANELPNLTLDLSKVTVSGLSSGGYMATQYHLANSDWVKGIGVIGTGPYYCAQGDIGVALSQCVSKIDSPLAIEKLTAKASEYADAGNIPSLSNLTDSKVWILHGSKDTTVNRPAAEALVSQYKGWIKDGNLMYVSDQPFGHHFPTLTAGTDCSTSAAPYLGNCNYDAAGMLLAHLYGNLNPRVEEPNGKLHSFDQQSLGGEQAATLADEGFVYIPQQCTTESCDLHISFHGCNQYAGAVGKAYASDTGLNHWADNNNIVVLYPQTKKSLFMPLNPQGCWDWWGYTDANYATQNGEQINAVTNMVNALSNNDSGA